MQLFPLGCHFFVLFLGLIWPLECCVLTVSMYILGCYFLLFILLLRPRSSIFWQRLFEKQPFFSRLKNDSQKYTPSTTQINKRQLGEPLRVHFRGLWHIWGALQTNWDHLSGRFFPSLTCPPASPVRFLWSKMGRTGVSHMYYTFYVQLASIGAILGSLMSVFGRFGPRRQIYPLFLILEGVANSATVG